MVQASKLVDGINLRFANKYNPADILIDIDDLEMVANKEDDDNTLRDANVNTEAPQPDHVTLSNQSN